MVSVALVWWDVVGREEGQLVDRQRPRWRSWTWTVGGCEADSGWTEGVVDQSDGMARGWLETARLDSTGVLCGLACSKPRR